MSTVAKKELANKEPEGKSQALTGAAANEATLGAGSTHEGAPPPTDGTDDASLELELTQMESDADRLHKEGVISTDDAAMKKAEVAKTRRLFRDLPAEDRAAIIRRRREIGRQLLERQLSGAAVVQVAVRLNHTRLKPLFEQWWPYLNRMSINMQRFGQSTFGTDDKQTVDSWFEKQLDAIEEYVDEQLRVAEGFRKKSEADLRERGDCVFEPSIPMPALAIDVEAYSRFSMRVLTAMTKFDRAMDHFDFMVWNGIRDQSDVDSEVVRFLKKVNPLGVRGYMTHLRLMTTVRGG
jgi:hypothetical protein